MDNMIEVKGLKKSYGSTEVLNIEELSIPKGQSFGLVGNNGAGKTTFFRLILDLIKPSGGEVLSKGSTVMLSEHWKGYTGAFLDEGFLIDYLTPEEYFDFIAKLYGLEVSTLKEKLAFFDQLFNGEILGKKKYIRDLSKGNQKKVGIVGALLGDPEILVLDEPFANLDPSTQYLLRDILKKLDAETEMTMLISSHDLIHVTEFCQRIVILDHGKAIKDIRTSAETLKELEQFFIREVKEGHENGTPTEVPDQVQGANN